MNSEETSLIVQSFWRHENLEAICEDIFAPLLTLNFMGIIDVWKNTELIWGQEENAFKIVLDSSSSQIREMSYYCVMKPTTFIVGRVYSNSISFSHSSNPASHFSRFMCDALYISGAKPSSIFPEMSFHELMERFLDLEEIKKMASEYLT